MVLLAWGLWESPLIVDCRDSPLIVNSRKSVIWSPLQALNNRAPPQATVFLTVAGPGAALPLIQVVSLHQHASAFQALVPLLSPTAPGPGAEPNTVTGPGTGGQVGPTWAHLPRVQAGKLLRKAKGSWRSALLLCAVMGDPQGPPRTPPLASTNGANADSPAPAPAPALGTQEGTGIGEHTQGKGQGQGGVDGEGAVQGAGVGLVSKKRVKLGSPGHASGTPLSDWELRCVGAADSIVAMGLEGVWDLKPLLNGREVISCLGLGKGSRETGVWVDRATEWQLAHPQGTPEECRAWLVEAQGSNDGKVRG